MSEYNDNRWHLDKRVPVAIIVTLILQAAAAVWWAGQSDNRITNLENRLSGMEQSVKQTVSMQNDINVRLARIEERTEGQTATLKRIEDTVNKLASK